MIGTLATGALSVPTPVSLNSYESIATAIVGSGGTAYVDFDLTSVTGYKHLQIRAIHTISGGLSNLYMTLNGSANSTYYHYVFGDGGGSATTGATASNIFTIQFGNASTTMNAEIIDILDYASNKNKTIRTLGGADYNGSGGVYLSSNLYATTSAITSIRIGGASYNLGQYSHFGLYGIVGDL